MKSSFMLVALTALSACAGPQAAGHAQTGQSALCKPREESRAVYVVDGSGRVVGSTFGTLVTAGVEQNVTVPPPPDCGRPVVSAAPAPKPAAPKPAPAAPPPVDPCAEGQKHTPDQCPNLDDDGDGIVNKDDRCPNESGPADNQGCPRVVVASVTKKIELREKVQFEAGKATIRPESDKLLDEVASVMKQHSEIKSVVIEGHTDTSGSAALNKRLSQARADAVMKAVVARGVEKSRLSAKGFGPAKPIATNDTPEGREANRRVEISIAGMAQ